MTILLRPPNSDALSFEIDHQIATILAALRKSGIKIRGAGRFGNSAAILLQSDYDTKKVLEGAQQLWR